MLKRKIPWDRKPNRHAGIDWSNPLNKGTVFSCLFNQGSVIDDVGKSKATLAAGSYFSVTKDGKGLSSDAASNSSYADFANADMPTITKEQTFLIVFAPKFGSTDAGSAGFQSIFDTTSSNTEGIRVFWTDTLQWRFRLFASSAVNCDATATPFNSGDIIALICRYNGVNMEVFQGGESLATASQTGNYSNPIDDWRFGQDRQTPTNPESLNGTILFSNYWDRALSNAEIRSISINPYQLRQPRTQYFPTEAVAAPTFTGKSNPFYGPLGGPLHGVIA